MDWLKIFITQIQSGTLLSNSMFESIDLDQALDRRDNTEFAQTWVTVHASIESDWNEKDLSKKWDSEINKLRKLVFLTTSRATYQHEIASYVSDDFELIAKAKITNSNNVFIQWLLAQYTNGVFPYHGNPQI
jgi:hypothetical protein